MNTALCLLTSEDLSQLAGALRSGRLAPPFTPILLQRYLPESMAGRVAAELQQRADQGMQAAHLGELLEILNEDRTHRPVIEDQIDLVWTGPEAPGIVNRDTSVVVREMFHSARESVLVAGYAVYQGQVIFKELAERMEQNPRLRVQMYLDIQRLAHDPASPSEVVRSFADRFVRKEWPGRLLPRLYYDPRSLHEDRSRRASLHAKCIVIDEEQAFVSSANFTEAAQTKNIEVGIRLVSRGFAQRLVQHFESLAAAQIVRPIPVPSVQE